MQDISVLVICYGRRKVISSIGSIVGYGSDGDIVDIVLIA